ncbi:MAG: lysine--tRNA ligase [Chloroflexia bacterium]
MELNEYQRRRLEKAEALRRAGTDPYPARCHRTHSVAEVWRSLPFPEEAVSVQGTIRRAEEGFDLVSGRDRLSLLELPADFSPAGGEIACRGFLALSEQGRLALRVASVDAGADASCLTVAEARARIGELAPVTLAGRLTGGIRVMGGATFVDLEDGSIIEDDHRYLHPHIQLFLSQDMLGEEAYSAFQRFYDAGDIVETTGRPFFTRMGQLSLHVQDIRMLSKALTPPPEKFHGLTDVETRLRERYADLLANPEVRDRFRRRAELVRAIRSYLDARGFLEVETPILQPIYGGAAARPFVTHHNQLDQDLYLRISFELYLKRLLVGMYERVYEIGHDFRNEGVDRVHNPEFTQLELYQAYTDYHGMMELFEDLIASVAREVFGTCRIVYQGQEIDLTPPWRRIPLFQAIREACGIDVEAHPQRESLYVAIRARGGEPDPKASWGKLVDYILSTYVEPSLVQPTFLVDYPLEISPLSKRRPDRPDLVERFEGFIAGMEVCNAFSELNDPIDQEERFLSQGRALEAGDLEAHPMDTDFLRALMYGMPPAGGLGTGIDRLAMIFTDQTTIREVILFPHLRQPGA